MAEELLVREPLTREMIDGGRILAQRLRKTEPDVTAAFWLYLTDNARWSLTFGFAEAFREGTLDAYTLIQFALAAEPVEGVSFSDVMVLQHDHPVIGRLFRYVEAGGGASEFRVSRSVVEGAYIEDAYVYFVSYRREQAA